MMTGLRGNPLHWDGRERVTPAPIEFRPRKRVLELSCGVRSLQQVPWWNAGRRARSAERAPRPYGAEVGLRACRRSASLLFVGHDRAESRSHHRVRYDAIMLRGTILRLALA